MESGASGSGAPALVLDVSDSTFGVTIGLLSGDTFSVSLGIDQTIKELKEKAEQELGRKIQHLVLETNTLREDLTLRDLVKAGVEPPFNTITAVCIVDTQSVSGWLFLHPIHRRYGSAAPVPWRDPVRESPKMGRHQLLLNLLHRVVTDQDLSTAPSAKDVAAEVPVPIWELLEKRAASQPPLPMLQLSGGQLQAIDAESGDLIFDVSLLMADLVYLSASSRSEGVRKGFGEYVLALAPRPNTVTEESAPELQDVWLLCSEVGLGTRWAQMSEVQILHAMMNQYMFYGSIRQVDPSGMIIQI